MQRLGLAMREAVAAMRAQAIVPDDALVNRVDRNPEAGNVLQCLGDLDLLSFQVQHQIALAFAGDLRPENIDFQVVVLDQMIDNRGLRLALGEFQEVFMCDNHGEIEVLLAYRELFHSLFLGERRQGLRQEEIALEYVILEQLANFQRLVS